MSRSNRALLRAQATKTGAESEGTSIEAAVSLIQEMRAERKELRERLEAAEKKEATTREERERLWSERRLLQLDIEERDRQIRYLKGYLRDAGVEIPPEAPATGVDSP